MLRNAAMNKVELTVCDFERKAKIQWYDFERGWEENVCLVIKEVKKNVSWFSLLAHFLL